MSLARGLSEGELTICQRVFAGTLSADFLKTKVMLANGLGAGDRPFTSIDLGRPGSYKIFIGPNAFDAGAVTTIDYKGTFVHEMTHVWQMRDSWFGAVWANSLVTQACRQGNAYLYGEGNLKKPWDSFGVEEQAQIVEDWFKNGLQSSDPRFHYIRNNIRKGNAGFVGDLPGGIA
jgi:hypothetical protein